MFSSKCETFALHVAYALVAELFSKWGEQVHVKNTRKFLWFELATVTSQALKYDIINFFSIFKQFYSKFDKPPTTPIYTTPYLSYTTLTWAHKCN